MRLLKLAAVLSAVVHSMAAAGGLPPYWQSATVLSQNLTSSSSSLLLREHRKMTYPSWLWNRVTVQTSSQVLDWCEVGTKPLALPVNGFIQFYRDGDLYVVLDRKGRKHKFAVVGSRNILTP